MPIPMLWHIPLSHYNEKVRWTLDYKRIPHHRRVLGPNYLFKAWRATGQGHLPILWLNDKPIHDSTAIIAALEQQQPEPGLYPKDPALRARALELEDYFDEKLGPAVRASIVTPLFARDPDIALRVLTTGMPAQAYETRRPLTKVFPIYYRWRHKISAARIEQDRNDVRASLDRMAAEIQPSGYLVGDAFSVADLTAAALLGAGLQPPEIQYPMTVQLPEYMQAWREEVRRHPASQWALGIYQKHRGKSAEVPRSR